MVFVYSHALFAGLDEKKSVAVYEIRDVSMYWPPLDFVYSHTFLGGLDEKKTWLYTKL